MNRVVILEAGHVFAIYESLCIAKFLKWILVHLNNKERDVLLPGSGGLRTNGRQVSPSGLKPNSLEHA